MRQDVGERSGPMTGEGLDATMAREGWLHVCRDVR